MRLVLSGEPKSGVQNSSNNTAVASVVVVAPVLGLIAVPNTLVLVSKTAFVRAIRMEILAARSSRRKLMDSALWQKSLS